MTSPSESPRWEVLDESVLDTGDVVILRRRGEMYDIRFNGAELMSNADPASELAFGRAAATGREIGGTTDEALRVLIGGLGMGFTLRAALDQLPDACEVDVCELVPAVVRWNRNEIGQLAGWPLRDPRVRVVSESVQAYLARSDLRYDVVLLDTDNGPDWTVRDENAVLYRQEGLSDVVRRLKPQGVAGFWSAARSTDFEERLATLGLTWTTGRIFLGEPGQEPFHVVYYVSPPVSAGRQTSLTEEPIVTLPQKSP